MTANGTQQFKIVIELTLEREWDHGWPETPNTDYTFIDSVQVISSNVPMENLQDLNADDESCSENFDVIMSELKKYTRGHQ